MDQDYHSHRFSSRPLWRVYLPLVIFIVSSLAIDFSVFLVLTGPTLMATLLIEGVLLGQVCWLVIVSALWSQDWLKGLIAGTCLAMAGVLCFALGQNLQYAYFLFLWETLVGGFAIPLVLICSAIPFYGLRHWRGWFLGRGDATPRSQGAGGIENLFIGTAVVASAIYIARVPLVIWNSTAASYWAGMGVMCFTIALVSALALVPFAIVSLQTNASTLQRVRGQLICCISTLLVVLVFYYVAATVANAPFSLNDLAAQLLLPASIAYLVTAIGIACMHASGLRLQRSQSEQTNRTDSQSTSRVPDDTSPRGNRLARTQHRYLAAGFLSCALIASLAMGSVERSRANQEQVLFDLNVTVTEKGGKLLVSDSKVIGLELWPGATDADLEEYLHLRQISSLSLAETRITPDGLKQLRLLPNLAHLNLDGIQLNEQHVEQLGELPYLQHVSLARTGLPDNIDTVLFRTNTLRSVALSDMRADLADLERFVSQTLFASVASLREMPLSDEDVLQLIVAPHGEYISSVDLSGTDVNGSCLAAMASVRKVVLRDVPVTDKEIGKWLPNSSVEELELANTQLTDAVLAPLMKTTTLQELVLGDGLITEQGLTNNRLNQLVRLSLNSRQYTGICFQDWPASLQELDMSHSGITDDTVATVTQLPALTDLDLSHTSITDASLPVIAKMPIPYRVDLTDTLVTAQGLSKGDLANFTVVVVGVGQFSPDELRLIKKSVALQVGGDVVE